jgi:hypothetical protein
MNELREDFNKHQNETKDTIKTEIYELKMKTQNIKELNKDMSLYSNKKHSGRPLQQTRTIGRQNLRAWR